MNAVPLFRRLRAFGIEIEVVGETLRLRAPTHPPPALIAEVRHHKSELIAILRGSSAARHDPADWRALFEERAAHRQYEGGYRRDIAERLAFAEMIELWCEQHPLDHKDGCCAGCGRPLGSEVLPLPDGGQVHWERHREFSCLISYGAVRIRRAITSLSGRGLLPPPSWQT